MISSTRSAFSQGIRSRVNGHKGNPYKPSIESLAWMKGYLGLDYKDQEKAMLIHELGNAKAKIATLEDNIRASGDKGDTFSIARLNSLANELSASKLIIENLSADVKDKKSVIDKLSADISKHKRLEKKIKNSQKHNN